MLKKSPFAPFDFLSPEPTLYIHSSSRYTSIPGIISSIFLFLAFFIIILYFFIDFLIGSTLTLVYSKEDVSEDFSFNLNNKLLAFTLQNLETGYVDPRVASLVPVLWRYNGTQSTVIDIPIEQCEFGKHISEDVYGEMFQSLDIHNFQCLNTEDIDFNLFFNKTEWSGSFIIIFFQTCVNTTENENFCYPQEDIDNMMKNGSYFFSYLLETVKIDHYNYTNPMSVSSYFQQVKMSYEERFDINVYYSPIEYKTDKGWLFESIKTENNFQFDPTLTTQTKTSLNQHYYYSNVFSKFQIGINYSTKEKYKRTYPKIQSVIANISGLVQVCFQIVQMIVYIFTYGQYYSFFFEHDSPLHESPSSINSNNNKSISVNSEIKLFSVSKRKLMLSPQRKMSIERTKKKIKVTYCMSFKWMMLPRKCSKLNYISRFEKKVKETLNIECLFSKMLNVERSMSSTSFVEKTPKNSSIINIMSYGSKEYYLNKHKSNVNNIIPG